MHAAQAGDFRQVKIIGRHQAVQVRKTPGQDLPCRRAHLGGKDAVIVDTAPPEFLPRLPCLPPSFCVKRIVAPALQDMGGVLVRPPVPDDDYHPVSMRRVHSVLLSLQANFVVMLIQPDWL